VLPVRRLFLVVLLLFDSVVFVSTPGITLLTGSHFVIVLTVAASLYLTQGTGRVYFRDSQMFRGEKTKRKRGHVISFFANIYNFFSFFK